MPEKDIGFPKPVVMRYFTVEILCSFTRRKPERDYHGMDGGGDGHALPGDTLTCFSKGEDREKLS